MAFMEARGPSEVLEALEWLLTEERELSDLRRRLHARIDLGFRNEVTELRERQISDERRRLHQRIDALRAELAGLTRESAMPLSERRRRLRALG